MIIHGVRQYASYYYSESQILLSFVHIDNNVMYITVKHLHRDVITIFYL